MNEGLTASDVLALTRNDENEMWNNPFIYLVWLAVLGGGGLFGNRGDAAVQGALTRSDLYEGFNTQEINGQLRGITNGICDGFYAVNSGMKDGFYGIQGALAENRFASQQCCCETNRNIDAVRYEGAQNTCAITNAIHAEGEATRALINANVMQELRDKLEARDRDVMVRDFQLSQLAQTSSLIGELRPCAKPAYITCSPYTTAGTCGAFGI
jgi:hypothetical protein